MNDDWKNDLQTYSFKIASFTNNIVEYLLS